VANSQLDWQSKLILLLVLPPIAVEVVFAAQTWFGREPWIAISILGLSALLALLAWRARAATPGGAGAGGMLTASLMFATASLPFSPLRTALIPVLVLLVLTSSATRAGRQRKERRGTAEHRAGRKASQVAANLGAAALVSCGIAQSWQWNLGWLQYLNFAPNLAFIAGLAALCEAAADTVSSELGQILSGRPRLITSGRLAEPGTDGAVSLGGSGAGVAASALVACAGSAALGGGLPMFLLSWTGGTAGLFLDSLLGATLERRGWLNNDGVNFLSTLGAIACALGWLGLMSRASGVHH
jgi:uncharacterized protein (TIGR00297 family)